ncbi:Poly-beta-1,6-N-acetyl-D-glucosamine N-deacetylase [Halomicronema hongdechloris C2206]|uniref:Poly-beta-1,6-N-acetyl-D-glucosamine N-deacetylase n=1 Tax=Halomicronema hongdechloris C2206 TaxID=1641165 RepID=A0A1Z3HI59_9CYAN|nr:polysaccharide deacetylase family protein [Halomicronema hongdechloris]ASC69971.1 Poly-beta-1,6-N-acetyl-D-glucosamine N-deacetylase [Halomicronema hongdechloris C2206]
MQLDGLGLGKRWRLRPRYWGTLGVTAVAVAAAIPAILVIQPELSPPARRQSFPVTLPAAPAVVGMAAFPTEVSSRRVCHTPLATDRAEATSDSGVLTEELASRLSLPIPYLPTRAWPAIHADARLAKVPVLMYHDVLTTPQVFFDVTPSQLAEQFQQIRRQGLTPISLEQLVNHLHTGRPLPEKSIVLSFDDGYAGHYTHVYPLLQQYGYPAVFSVFTGKLDGTIAGRSRLSWTQLQDMAQDPLVTIAAHSVTHPPDLRSLPAADLRREVTAVKARLEAKLDKPIHYFTYPAGHYDERVMAAVEAAGYRAALTMSNTDEAYAGESDNLLAIARFGQSTLSQLLDQAWAGPPAPSPDTFQFSAPVQLHTLTLEGIPLALATGGWPVTIHADSRYQVPEIIAHTNAVAAVDGGFFSLKYLDSNVMIGPVLSQNSHTFVPGNASENRKLAGRPLVLMSPEVVKYIPFQPAQHNTLQGLRAELPRVTDAFVAAAWLVKDGEAQPASAFGNLFDFEAQRHRAFWGINQAGQPVVGVSQDRVDSVTLGQLLQQLGLRDAVMVDSGASTSLAYQGDSLMGYEPRPVPHVVALIPPHQATGPCPLLMRWPSRTGLAPLGRLSQ